MEPLRLGGHTIDRAEATTYAGRYLGPAPGWAYPSYDEYGVESATGPLVDADLLAPVLLNARMTVSAYEGLHAAVPRLQQVLDQIPPDLDLAEAGADAFVPLIGHLFAVLDGDGIHGVRGTILAKLLHRKRPHFIPLYDAQVGSVYATGDAPPVPWVPGRSWASYQPLFVTAVQSDLRREAPFWGEIAALASSKPISRLRALDIVAWHAGKGMSKHPESEDD